MKLEKISQKAFMMIEWNENDTRSQHAVYQTRTKKRQKDMYHNYRATASTVFCLVIGKILSHLMLSAFILE